MAILFLPSIVFADVGIPVIMATTPLMILALIPVILIESWILMKYNNRKLKKVIIPVGLGNLTTTLLGYPLLWLL